jgi:glycosyltransferase involved in cell wall biosynthesis
VTFLSVVVPVYNEGARLPATIRRISEYLRIEYPDHEIVAVDDGSLDGSPETLESLVDSVPGLRVVRYSPNQGKGVAVRKGCAAATGDWVAIVDADLELPIELLRVFFRVQRETGAQVVIGSKRHPDSVVEVPKVRARLSRAYGRGIRLLFRLPVSDTQVGFKLIDRRALSAVHPYLFAKRFAFDVELLVLLNRCGARIAEAPVQLRYSRGDGGGRIKFSAIANIARESGGIFYRLYVTGFYRGAVAGSIPTAPPSSVPATYGALGPGVRDLHVPVLAEMKGAGGVQLPGNLVRPAGGRPAEPAEFAVALRLEREADGRLGVRLANQTIAVRPPDVETVDRPHGALGRGPAKQGVGAGGPRETRERERPTDPNDRSDLLPHPGDRPGVVGQEASELDRDTDPVGALVLPAEIDMRRGLHTDIGVRPTHRLDHESAADARALDARKSLEPSRRVDAGDQLSPRAAPPAVQQQRDQLRLNVFPLSIDEEDAVPVPVEGRAQERAMMSDRSAQGREVPRLRLWRSTEEVGRERRVDRNYLRSRPGESTDSEARRRSSSGVEDHRSADSSSLADPP